MAKSGTKSGWEAVKPTKTKPKVEKEQKASPPKAKIVSSISPKVTNNKPKQEKSKKSANNKPTKKPFEIKDSDVDKLAGSATGILANVNCLNYLTAEFTAPERIPPYDKEPKDFPSCKLSPKHKERVDKILSSLQDKDSRVQFLKVLVNNMISASRQAENAWGARVVGQMLMKKYPDLSRVESDVLGTETHPGAVLSIIWMFTQVKEFKSLMSVLFWLVLPRLKQKKIAEYLPKLLGDIELSIQQGGPVQFAKSHIAHLVFSLDDTKLTRPTMSVLSSFFNSIRPRLEPDHTWIESFIPLLTSATKQLALPIILKAVEADPAKAAQELKRLSDNNRLQVDLIVESCPPSTLSQKYRDIISSKLSEPMATSEEIRKHKRSKKTERNGQKTEKDLKSGSVCSSLFKILFYSTLLVGLSSQLEVTRPVYNQYAEPYVVTYIKPVMNEYVVPKYEEFVEPHVSRHLIPAYKSYLAPHVKTCQKLWSEKGSPVLMNAISKVETIYADHLSGQVNKLVDYAGPILAQLRSDAATLVKSVRENNKDFFANWEKKAESILEDFRGYVAVAGIEARRLIDLSVEKGSEFYAYASHQGIELSSKASDLLKNGSSDGMEKAKVMLSDFTIKAQESFINALSIGKEYLDVGLVEGNKYMILAMQKTGVYYEQFLDATVDQRAIIVEKGKVAMAWGQVQSAEVIRLLDEYKVSTYLENGFEMCGRSMLWLGDMMAELAGMRWCCLKARFRKLGNNVYEFGEVLSKKIK